MNSKKIQACVNILKAAYTVKFKEIKLLCIDGKGLKYFSAGRIYTGFSSYVVNSKDLILKYAVICPKPHLYSYGDIRYGWEWFYEAQIKKHFVLIKQNQTE